MILLAQQRMAIERHRKAAVSAFVFGGAWSLLAVLSLLNGLARPIDWAFMIFGVVWLAYGLFEFRR